MNVSFLNSQMCGLSITVAVSGERPDVVVSFAAVFFYVTQRWGSVAWQKTAAKETTDIGDYWKNKHRRPDVYEICFSYGSHLWVIRELDEKNIALQMRYKFRYQIDQIQGFGKDGAHFIIFLNLSTVPTNLFPGWFAHFLHVERSGIITN